MSENVWDYPRPPRLERSPRRIVVGHLGTVIADSIRTLRILETSHPPVYYLPRADIVVPLHPSPRRTVCEYKGTARYWHLRLGDGQLDNVGWSYDRPHPDYSELAGAVAFYAGRLDGCTVDGELVTPQPGDFYGGWLTGDIVGAVKGGPGTAGW